MKKKVAPLSDRPDGDTSPGPGPRGMALLTRRVATASAEVVAESLRMLEAERDQLIGQLAEMQAQLREANTRATLAESLEHDANCKVGDVLARWEAANQQLASAQAELEAAGDRIKAQQAAIRKAQQAVEVVEAERDEAAKRYSEVDATIAALRAQVRELTVEARHLRLAMGLPVAGPPLLVMDDSQPWVPCPHLLVACQARLYWRCVYLDWQVCPQKIDPEFLPERCPGFQRVRDNPLARLWLLSLL
jgi:hypothetical protein